MKRVLWACVMGWVALLAGAVLAQGEILVKVRPTLGTASVQGLHARAGAVAVREVSAGWQQVRLPAGLSLTDGLARYRGAAGVEAVQPNFTYHTAVVPNDPNWSSLWGMSMIGAPAAWDVTTGSETVAVAVIDSGVDYTHLDLRDNMWRNPGEVAGDGLDNDNNGWVDDVYGVNTTTAANDPQDNVGHGTHLAGTIGAVGNNGIGVTGVCWRVKIIACKFMVPDGHGGGTGTTADAVRCLDYLVTLKGRGVNVRVANLSWCGPASNGNEDLALQEAMARAGAAGILCVCAAGNGGGDLVGDNNDLFPQIPASFDLDNIIAVGASTSTDGRASFSNYGATSVDLAAPGVGIRSTVPGTNSPYGNKDGTSMATPHVAGAAALLWAKKPTLTVAEVKALLLGTVDVLPQWSGKLVSSGRLNLARAMARLSVTAKPDALVKAGTDTAYLGENMYNVAAEQTKTQSIEAGGTVVYHVKVQHDGTGADNLRVTAPAAPAGWTVHYYSALTGGTDITGQVQGNGWQTPLLEASAGVELRLEVTPGVDLAPDAAWTAQVTAVSTTDPTKSDTVLAVTRRRGALTKVTLSASPLTPQVVNTPVTLAAVPTGGVHVEYRFRAGYKTSTGAYEWTTLQEYAASTGCVWVPTVPRTYTIVVYAREQGSRQTYQAYHSQYYTVTSGISLAVSAVSPQPAGTPLTLTAARSGGGNTEYWFWAWYLDDGVWQWITLQEYGTKTTCLWTPVRTGAYTLGVGARAIGSSVPYEVYETKSFTITVPLRGVQLTTSLPSPRPANIPIILTATPDGGSQVEYQFRAGYKTATGTWVWTTLHGYAAGATCTWTPTEARTYTIVVYARETGSTATYQVYKSMYYSITGL